MKRHVLQRVDRGQPLRRSRQFSATLIALACLVWLSGCQSINGLIYGFERDVDTLVAAMDRATADLLPSAGPSPTQPTLTHVDFPDTPNPNAQRWRFGRPR